MGILSNYCGFGGEGIPQHTVDEICAEHDRDYAAIQAKGENPYLHFNWADKKMLQSLEKHSASGFREHILKLGATALWNVKKVATSSLSDSPPMAKTKTGKRERDDNITPLKKKMKNLRVEPDGDVQEEEMEEAPPVAAVNALRSSGSTGASHGYKETAIIHQQPHYGVPEVMTVILPWTQYFSVCTADNSSGVATDFRVRMTSLSDYFPDSIGNAGGLTGSAYTQGIWNSVVGGTGSWPSTVVPFPATPATKTNEHAAWQQYFLRMYQAYTVLKCEWEVTFHNPRNRVNADVMVAVAEEAYSGSSSGNVVPASALLVQAENWPGLRWTHVDSSGDNTEERCWKVMKGTYYPGQANKNVRNDESVQTWTTYTDPVNPSAPSLTEQLHFMLWKAPFNDGIECQQLNVRLHLRITAQLRDLNVQFRYPLSGQSAVTLTAPADVFSVD